MRRASALIALLAAATMVSGCTESKQPTPDPSSRPLVIGAFDRPRMINPILSNFGVSAVLIDFIFDGLVRLDENFSVEPGLAEKWSVSEDGLRWTFHLRRDVTFHDGKPLTASDVKFTFDVIGNPKYVNPHSHILPAVKEVVVLDPYTLRLDLKNPFPSLPYYLTFGVLPKGLYEGEDLRSTPLNTRPVGTGAYRLERWSEEGIVFKANKSYFLGEPGIDTILVKIFDSRMAAWAELMRGNIDLTFVLEPETIQVISGLPRLKVYRSLHPYYNILLLNHKKALFEEKLVRQAMNYAVDKRRMIRDALSGAGVPVSSLAYPGSLFDNQESLEYPYEPDTASRLLAQSGWKDTDDDGILERDGKEFRFTVHVPEGGFIPEKAAILIQRQLADVGIRVKMVSLPLDELSERAVKKKNFDALLWSFITVGEPDANCQFWSSSQIDSGFNFSSYRSAEVDRLIEKGRQGKDLSSRLEAYRSFQRAIFEDPPGVFLYWRVEHFALPKNIKGAKVGPGGTYTSIYRWYYDGTLKGAPQ